MYLYQEIVKNDDLHNVVSSDGFAFGFSVFETMKVVSGEPEYLGYHIERLYASGGALDISLPDESEIMEKLESYASRLEDGTAVKVQAAKSASGPIIVFSNRKTGYSGESYDRGFNAMLSKCVRDENAVSTYHKTSNYMTSLLEKRHAAERGFDEAVFLNTKGFVSEGCTTNIFFSRGDDVFTPRIENGLLPGIIRRVAIEMMTDVRACDIHVSELEGFDGAVLTNSLVGIIKLNSIDDITYPNSEILYKKMTERIALPSLR
jgi:4-amino-4-deoxychorismate lyase